MRSGWILALCLLVPIVSAQVPEMPLVEASIDAFEAPIVPLQGVAPTAVHVRASCALAEPVVGVPIMYAVTGQPAWATVVVSPASDARPVEACDGGWVTAEAVLTVTLNDQAPAFSPAPIVVTVTAGNDARQRTAQASVNVSAAYFGIFDVTVREPQITMAPGDTRELLVKATNFGNAPTRVEASVVSADGLDVSAPAPVVLESKQGGGNAISADLVLRVTAPSQGGFVNQVHMVLIKVQGAYATDDRYRAADTTVSFLVTVRSGVDESGAAKGVPLPAPLALLALALTGALMTRRR